MITSDCSAIPVSIATARRDKGAAHRPTRWLLKHRVQPVGPEATGADNTPQAWWRVSA